MDLHAILIHLIRESVSSNKKRLSCDKKVLGEFFHTAAISDATKTLLSDIAFHDNYGYPSAPAVNDAIQRLQLTGVLGQPNPIDMRSEIMITSEPWDAVPYPSTQEDVAAFKLLLTRFKDELCHE